MRNQIFALIITLAGCPAAAPAAVPADLAARAEAAHLFAVASIVREEPTPAPTPSPDNGDERKAEIELEASGAKSGWLKSTLVDVANMVVETQREKSGIKWEEVRKIAGTMEDFNRAMEAFKRPRMMAMLAETNDAPVYFFTAPRWCVPCRGIHKHIDLLDADDRQRIIVVDMDQPFPDDTAKAIFEQLKDPKGEISIPQLVTTDEAGKVKAKKLAAGMSLDSLTTWIRSNK